jgi:hypothetical protein
MTRLMTATAFAALLATVPAWAQAPQPMPAENAPAVTQPAPIDNQTGRQLPITGDAATNPPTTAGTDAVQNQAAPPAVGAPATATDTTTTVTTTTTTVATDTYIDRQLDGQILATDVIGQTVYNRADENLGDINDIVFGTDGNMVAVIIGVGGFLGIGEKDVAIAFDQLEPVQDQDGKVRMVLDANKEALENAPDFATLEDVNDEARRNAATDRTPMTPAPAR